MWSKSDLILDSQQFTEIPGTNLLGFNIIGATVVESSDDPTSGRAKYPQVGHHPATIHYQSSSKCRFGVGVDDIVYGRWMSC